MGVLGWAFGEREMEGALRKKVVTAEEADGPGTGGCECRACPPRCSGVYLWRLEGESRQQGSREAELSLQQWRLKRVWCCMLCRGAQSCHLSSSCVSTKWGL